MGPAIHVPTARPSLPQQTVSLPELQVNIRPSLGEKTKPHVAMCGSEVYHEGGRGGVTTDAHHTCASSKRPAPGNLPEAHIAELHVLTGFYSEIRAFSTLQKPTLSLAHIPGIHHGFPKLF